MERIGFVGLGNMGLPMSTSLLEEGYSVCGYDLNEEAVASFIKVGGVAKYSLSEIIENSDVIFTSLPSSTAVEEVFIGEGGLRSEEHTSELQSRGHLVCRLLLEK